MTKKKTPQTGVCHLVKEYGVYVNSHIIPLSVTRPVGKNGFIQGGGGKRPIRRWSSWSDRELVIRKGEDVLSTLDGWAIPFLRRHKLLWSGWKDEDTLSEDYIKIPNTPWGLRTIKTDNIKRLRVFFLSLLWRAAASSLWECSEVVLPEDDLEHLRNLIVSGEDGAIDFYPCQLIQLSTKGDRHNLSPIRMKKCIDFSENGDCHREVEFFRFYFDGLIIHFHIHNKDEGYTKSVGNLIVGPTEEFAVTTVTYEESFQAINLRHHAVENRLNFPNDVARLLRLQSS